MGFIGSNPHLGHYNKERTLENILMVFFTEVILKKDAWFDTHVRCAGFLKKIMELTNTYLPSLCTLKRSAAGCSFFFLMGIMIDQKFKLGIIQEELSKLIDSKKEKPPYQKPEKYKHFCWGCCSNGAKWTN